MCHKMAAVSSGSRTSHITSKWIAKTAEKLTAYENDKEENAEKRLSPLALQQKKTETVETYLKTAARRRD